MKYVGFVLFILIFIAVAIFAPARDFYSESMSLAPEITILVSICYVYIVVLTFVLNFFPNLSYSRPQLYDTHVKMACSVMVSMGLVGTFLGLVDMIAGIGVALSGEDNDFSARMAALLEAISTSLGAMAFAFMTSILGVGISAYALVASTFVSSSFQEVKRIETQVQARQQAVVAERKFAAEVSKYVDDKILDRIQALEDKLVAVRLDHAGSQISPVVMSEILTKHHEMLVEFNTLLMENVSTFNENISTVSSSLKVIADDFSNHYIALNDLNKSVKQNNVMLIQLQQISGGLEKKIGEFSERVRGVFKDI